MPPLQTVDKVRERLQYRRTRKRIKKSKAIETNKAVIEGDIWIRNDEKMT